MTKPKLIDISYPICPEKTPVWPGSTPIIFTKTRSLDCGDSVDERKLQMNLHTGTHIDAPSHFLADGETMETFSLEQFIGLCTVVDLSDVQGGIEAHHLEKVLSKPPKKLLIKTRNSQNHSKDFDPTYAGILLSAAQKIVEWGVELVGIDYLSIQPYKTDKEIHKVLLRNHVAILEGLRLEAVTAGTYELLCLPLKLVGTEAAPARAVLKTISS